MAAESNSKKDEKDKPGSSGLASLMNFIPSAYYDLIARVCPGMAFWLALSFRWPLLPGLDPAASLSDLNGPALVVLVALSYVSGIVLTGFSVAWDWVSLLILSANRTMAGHLGLDAPAGTAFSSRWKAVSLHIDGVIKEDEGAGRLLVKAMAEVTLCQNLLSGLVVLAFIGHYSGGERFFAPAGYGAFYAAITFALFLSMVFRQAMFLGRVKDLHALYVPQQLQFPAQG